MVLSLRRDSVVVGLGSAGDTITRDRQRDKAKAEAALLTDMEYDG